MYPGSCTATVHGTTVRGLRHREWTRDQPSYLNRRDTGATSLYSGSHWPGTDQPRSTTEGVLWSYGRVHTNSRSQPRVSRVLSHGGGRASGRPVSTTSTGGHCTHRHGNSQSCTVSRTAPSESVSHSQHPSEAGIYVTDSGQSVPPGPGHTNEEDRLPVSPVRHHEGSSERSERPRRSGPDGHEGGVQSQGHTNRDTSGHEDSCDVRPLSHRVSDGPVGVGSDSRPSPSQTTHRNVTSTDPHNTRRDPRVEVTED